MWEVTERQARVSVLTLSLLISYRSHTGQRSWGSTLVVDDLGRERLPFGDWRQLLKALDGLLWPLLSCKRVAINFNKVHLYWYWWIKLLISVQDINLQHFSAVNSTAFISGLTQFDPSHVMVNNQVIDADTRQLESFETRCFRVILEVHLMERVRNEEIRHEAQHTKYNLWRSL